MGGRCGRPLRQIVKGFYRVAQFPAEVGLLGVELQLGVEHFSLFLGFRIVFDFAQPDRHVGLVDLVELGKGQWPCRASTSASGIPPSRWPDTQARLAANRGHSPLRIDGASSRVRSLLPNEERHRKYGGSSQVT